VAAAVPLAGAALAAAYVALSFDPAVHRARAVEFMRDATRGTLRIDGEPALRWLPWPAVEIGRASLTGHDAESGSASLERARIRLRLLPLLAGRAEAGAIELHGLHAELVRWPDGSERVDAWLGWLGASPAGQPDDARAPVPELPGIALRDAQLTWHDRIGGTRHTLAVTELVIGRIASGVATPVRVSGQVRGEEPALSFGIGARGELTLWPRERRVRLHLPQAEAAGAALALTDFKARLVGDLEYAAGAGRYSFARTVFGLTGTAAGRMIDLKLDVPSLVLAPGEASAEKLRLGMRARQGADTLAGELVLPALRSGAGAAQAATLSGSLDWKRAGSAVRVRLSAPLEIEPDGRTAWPARIAVPELRADWEGQLAGHALQGALKARAALDFDRHQFEMPRLAARTTLHGFDARGRDVVAELTANARHDHASGLAATNFDARIGESRVHGRLGSARAAPGRRGYRLDLEVDQLDLERWRHPRSAAAPGGRWPAGIGWLTGLELAGTVRIGALRATDLRMNNLRAELRAGGGRFEVEPLTATLHPGRIDAALRLEVSPGAGEPPRWAIRQQAQDIEVGALLRELAGIDLVEGRGLLALELSGSGNGGAGLGRSPSGTARLELGPGALRGIDLPAVLRGAAPGPAGAGARTEFSELRAAFDLRDGLASGGALMLRAPQFGATGTGTLDLSAHTIDYRLRATAAGSRAPAVTLRVSGPLGEPRASLEPDAPAGDRSHPPAGLGGRPGR
jgi:AsmA protein